MFSAIEKIGAVHYISNSIKKSPGIVSEISEIEFLEIKLKVLKYKRTKSLLQNKIVYMLI